MSNPTYAPMTLSEELIWRGFINQMTFSDIKDLDSEKRTFYWGVDPSASSMQVGNYAAAMMVRTFIEHGYQPILLIGGATGMIGDPDGKKQERDLLTHEEVAKNKNSIARQYEHVFGGLDFKLVDNYDWFKSIGYLDFLRDVGKYMSMAQMLDREFVQSRIGANGAGLSYAEFSYSLIQGYDFLHLYKEYGATLQVCGADQWGNSTTGVTLIRKLAGVSAHVYSTPLIINKSTGVKFGKSEAGAVWLDAEMTTPYQFYQFWLNTDDEGVGDYLKIFTRIMPPEYDELMSRAVAESAARHAQKYLAYHVTKIVHGDKVAAQAKAVTEVLFGEVAFAELSKDELDMLSGVIPATHTAGLVDALVEGGVATSKGEARRLLEGGAVSVNGQKVDTDITLSMPSLVKKGKNSFLLVQ